MSGATFAAINWLFTIVSTPACKVRLAKSDNATVVRRFSQRRSKHALNSNVVDCANLTKIPTPPSAKRYFPPDEHELYKDNFATGNGKSHR